MHDRFKFGVWPRFANPMRAAGNLPAAIFRYPTTWLGDVYTEVSNRYIAAAMRAEAGMVSNQATKMSRTIFQRTLLQRSDAPTPMIVEPMTCVVLTGPPSNAAPNMTDAPDT